MKVFESKRKVNSLFSVLFLFYLFEGIGKGKEARDMVASFYLGKFGSCSFLSLFFFSFFPKIICIEINFV